jgi:coenzyme F420 hydrogenase subunit beta
MSSHPSIRRIEQVLQADLCLGCGACSQVIPEKIQIKMSMQGYLRPHITAELSEAEQGLACAVCPGIHVEHSPALQQRDEMWGPVQSSQAGWSTDKSLRHHASSGGGLSALAGSLIKQGLVDAVLHIGVSAHDPLRNEYRISTSFEEIARHAGSRYAPAAPLLGLNEAMRRYKRLAFIGKPCDVVAVRKLAQVDPKVKEQVLYCLSFMCAGVPSIKGTHAVLKHLEAPVEQVIAFRYRGNGWPGLATAKTRDGQERSMTYDESWGQILNKHLQFRCKVCFDGTGEFSDITCADAWYGTEDGYPSFEEAEGRSLILARTTAGQQFLDQAIAAGDIAIAPLPVSDLPRIQPYQANRKQFAYSRLLAMKLAGTPRPAYSAKALRRLARQASLRANLKSFGGTMKRLLSKRANG